MEFYVTANYFIFWGTYFTGNKLIQTMWLVLLFEWLQQALTLQVFLFSNVAYTRRCTLRPSVSSSRLVSYPEFFWAYRCIYLMFTWVELGTHYDRGPCQKNVYKLEYLDWLKMHLKCTFQSGQRSFTKLDLEKLRLIFGYPYQFNSTKICLGMTLQTWYEVELFSNTPWEITIGEVLHWVTWLVCNIQTNPNFWFIFSKTESIEQFGFHLKIWQVNFV